MKAMEKKILEEGKVLPGGILKVGSFLNQQIDTSFLGEMAKEFARLYADAGVNKVLTIESSGIAIAAAVARELVETFAYAILYILIFVALVLLLRLAALAINLVLRLPVLFSVNTFGGALLGLLEGMMVVWLLIWLAPRLGIALPAENTYLLHFFMTVGPMGLLSSLS